MSCVPDHLRPYDIIDLGRDYREGVDQLRAAILKLRRRTAISARRGPEAKHEELELMREEVEQQLVWLRKLLEQDLIDKLQAEEEIRVLL